jgi:hypothetical protein
MVAHVGNLIGYARTSTADQSAGLRRRYETTRQASSVAQRAELNRALVPTRRHSCRLQGRRLARSTVGLWAIVEEQESLEEGGVATPRGGMWTARSALNLTARLA